MRLAAKIGCSIFFVLAVLLVLDGYLSVHRETDFLHREMKRNSALLGHAIRELVTHAWGVSGKDKALELIASVNKGEHQVTVRWVWLDVEPDDPDAPQAPHEKLSLPLHGRDTAFVQAGKGSSGQLLTYVPVVTPGERRGALELSESLSDLKEATRKSIVRTVLLITAMGLFGAIALTILGLRMIGRPLSRLIAKTERIGAGDFTGDLTLRSSSELSLLATAMNEMCERLAASQKALKKESEARIEALDQLRHAERLATIGQLSAGIAHELGTPLNVIAGRAKLIASGDLEPQETMEWAGIIGQQSSRMTRIIRQLLDFTRRRTCQKAPVKILHLVRQATEILETTARKQNVTIETVADPDLPVVELDHAQMQQVVMNLLLNGVQAMPEGGTLEVRLSCETTRRPSEDGATDVACLVVEISDEGAGIAPEHAALVFEPFFTTKGVGEGTGLGLSITHEIVQEHGGWIDVDGNRDQGACFRIFLPLEGRR